MNPENLRPTRQWVSMKALEDEPMLRRLYNLDDTGMGFIRSFLGAVDQKMQALDAERLPAQCRLQFHSVLPQGFASHEALATVTGADFRKEGGILQMHTDALYRVTREIARSRHAFHAGRN